MFKSGNPPGRQAGRSDAGRVMFIVLFGLALRALYVMMAQAEFPIRGDINQYVLYGWNLTHRGVFSVALPQDEVALPSNYRGPGYPFLIAGSMIVAGHSDLPLRQFSETNVALGFDTDTWMRIVFGIQVLLGAATVLLTMSIARFWLPLPWTYACGLIVALWPHLISFTGLLLSETLFGFLVLLAFWLLCAGSDVRSRGWTAASGLAWGAAYLTNPVVALFPLLAAAMIARRFGRSLAVVLLAGFAIMPVAWGLRGLVVADSGGALHRVEENFVQGSWPDFLIAFNSRFSDPISRRIVDATNHEIEALDASLTGGMSDIALRMAGDPVYYARWYLLDKPFLMWDWRIRVGAGDIYFLPVAHSPFDRIPLLGAVKSGFAHANPLVFALALVAIALILVLRRQQFGFAASALAGLVVYVTLVHDVLQAEPRYSVPYRPEEVLLAITALAYAAERIRKRVRGNVPERADSIGTGG